MTRTVKEWIGRTDDSMPPPAVRLRIYYKNDGTCYLCTTKLRPGHWDADHVVELADGGLNRETNLSPACRNCHKVKSAENHSARAEGKRHRQKAVGIKRQPRNPMPGSKASKWKKRLDGTVVRR